MRGQRNPFVAHEGLPLLALVAALVVFVLRYTEPWLALLPLAALVLLFLLFSDPQRYVPPVALGIVSPVDGEIVEVDITDRCVVQGQAHRVRIRINPWGPIRPAARSKGASWIFTRDAEGVGPDCPANALWVETDEGDSVVLQFHDYRFGLPPKSFVRLGDRVGQGTVAPISALRASPS